MNNEYKTKDLAEASALLTKEQKLLRIEREGRICWFVFENRASCQQLSNKFFFDDLLVSARKYYESMMRLKNRIFA